MPQELCTALEPPADRIVEVPAGICVGLYEKLITLEAEFPKKT
jgi:hypothetical protein